MSDHVTVSPEADDELRTRLRAFAAAVQTRADTEAALLRMPERTRPPSIRLLAVAACLAMAVAIAAVAMPDRMSVDTVPPAAPTTECPPPTASRAIVSGGQMNKRFAKPVATAATAILLLAACSDDDPPSAAADDGPTTVAKGVDIELVGSGSGLANQTLNIDAVEENGEVTGEFRVSEVVNTIRCADTSTDGFVILGGEITSAPDPEDPLTRLGSTIALVIREGDPDAVTLIGDDIGGSSCTELLESIPDELLTDDAEFVDVEDGYDIETG